MAGHTCKRVCGSVDTVRVDQGDTKTRVLVADSFEGDYRHSKSTVHKAVTACDGDSPGIWSSWSRNGVTGNQ
jgi:hypothetical protein